VRDAAWSAEVSTTAIGVGREEARGARRVLESSREEEMEAFEAERLRATADTAAGVRRRQHRAALSLSSLFRECEGSVWITEAELYF
jgi:hypothetical protein